MVITYYPLIFAHHGLVYLSCDIVILNMKAMKIYSFFDSIIIYEE